MGVAPLANLGHHAEASTPGETTPRDPPGTRATSETRETTPDTTQRADGRETSRSGQNRDDDSFKAFMESCMGHPHTVPTSAAPSVRPEQRRDHAEDTPLTIPRQAHLQRKYTALGRMGQATAAVGGHAAGSAAADQTTDGRSAPGSGARVEAGTNTASEPTSPPPGTAPPWGRGHLDYARLEGNASRPSGQAEQAAAGDLGLWIPRPNAGGQLALAVRIRWLLTSRSRHLAEGTRTMADITFGHRTLHTPPANMDYPDQWHYVATRLLAHMGAYNPDEMNGLHWQWHQRAALRIRATMREHNIWDTPGSPGYQGHASGHRQPRSQDVPELPGQAARRNSPDRPRGPPPGMGSPSGTYRSPLQPSASRRGPGSPHTSGVQGGTLEQRQETRNPGCSRRRSCTPPPAARRVVFHEGMGTDHGGHHDLRAQRTSSTTDPRRRSKRPHTNRAYISIILTPVERERQAALHAGPRREADEVSSSSAASRPGSEAYPLSGGPHATDTRPREPAADPRPAEGMGGQPPPHPPPRARGSDTGPGLGYRPPDRPDPWTTGSPTPAATQPNRQGTGGASQHRGHDASDQGADAEMTEAPGPQESDGPLPAAAPCSVPQQREPSMEYAPGGDPGTTSRHPSPTSATRDQDRMTMPPPPPRPPQQRGTGPFDDAELRALWGIQATKPSSELVAPLREHFRDVNPNRLFAVVPLPQAATTEIFVRQLQALVNPGTQISDDLVEAGICCFNTHQPAQGGVWVPHPGWVHKLIAPPKDPGPVSSTGGRERAAPPPRPEIFRIPPHEGLAAWESGTARDRGRNLTSLSARYPETARAAPPPRERDPSTIAMIVLENGHYYQVQIIPHPQESHWSLEAVDPMFLATRALPDSPTPLLNDQPPHPQTAIVSGTAGTWHPGHALYCLLRRARRRWPHTREWSATWRFYLDGLQQLEVIPQREPTAETPTAPNLCPVSAIHQIRALAMSELLQPTIRTETEAQAAHAALVQEIFSALHGALVRRVGNPLGPLAAAGHRTCNDVAPPQNARRESRAGHTQGRRRHGRGITSSRRRTGQRTSHQRLQNRPTTATTLGELTLPKRTPSYNPTTRGRATHSTDACRSGRPAGKT